MEQWESLVDACPPSPDLRFFSKAIQTAGIVLKEDLAKFEVEWILQTLLYKPVNLLSTVSTHRSDAAWTKPLSDTFKLLAEVIDNRPDDTEGHYEEIIKICQLNFDAQIRKHSVQCLASVARVSPLAASDVSRQIAALEGPARAQQAIFIGTICEYHPETVENEFNNIWRTFLNLLDSNKNTETMTSSLLQGILGLFKHFGSDLPTAELNFHFYDKMAADYIRGRAEGVCLKILAQHAPLFRERISRDARIRNLLWNILNDSNGSCTDGIDATTSVYRAICGCLQKAEIQKIATTELLPQTQSHRTQVKYTALRLLTYIQTNCGIDIDIDGRTDVQTLEFELRSGNVSYDVAEAVAWCIESNLPSSENLLQTAIIFYNNLPHNRRKHIVAHGILNAPEALRNAAITFLISESTQDADSIEYYQTLWRDLFDTDNGKDVTVVEKCRYVFEDFMAYVTFALDGCLGEGMQQKLSEKMTSLLRLTTLILSQQTQEEYSNDHCIATLAPLVDMLKLHPDAVTMSAARCACLHISDEADNLDLLKEFYEIIRIDSCKDETILCESCLALMQAPIGTVNVDDILLALKIIFSRTDVDPQMMIKALKKLETIIVDKNDDLNENLLSDVIRQIENVHNRKVDMSNKYGRILNRDILMFLGKYRSISEINNNNTDETIVVKLMESLMLNVSNPDEGTIYKLNLQRILQLAIGHEHPDSLQILLVIICANLSSKPDLNLQVALSSVCRALCRAHARGFDVNTSAVQAAITTQLTSETALQAMHIHISAETSPGVRRMLSDALEALLAKDHEDKMTSAVAEQASVMMRSHLCECNSDRSTSKRAGLNVTETLLSALKENNALTKNLVPELLITISTTYEIDSVTTFETGTKLFLDKIELFERNEIETLIKTLITNTFARNGERQNKMSAENANGARKHKMAEADVKIFRNIAAEILKFAKNVFEYKNEDDKKIVDVLFEIFGNTDCDYEKLLLVLAETKKNFVLNLDRCRNLVTFKEGALLNELFCMEIGMDEPYFCMEVVLQFLQEFAKVLLELHYQKTLKLLEKILTNITPQCVKYLHKTIKTCLSVYTEEKTPITLQRAFENWCSKLPIAEITNNIEKEVFLSEHSIIIYSLNVMLEFFDRTTLTVLSNHAQKWSRCLLKLYSSGYITNHLKSKMAYLSNVLTASLRFAKVTDVKRLILEGSDLDGLPNEKVGLEFCRFFINVFYEVLLRKPYFLLDDDMTKCCVILNDIVRCCLRKKIDEEQNETILDLVEKLWPIYELHTTFNQRHTLLLDLNKLPKKLGPESKPLQWAVNNIIYSDSSEEKARLIGVLPGGDCYSEAYRSFASLLPTRLSELKGHLAAMFRSLLDALASTGREPLPATVAMLASGDDTKGWWDDAIDSCMASLAARADLALCKAIYTRCWEGLSLGVCNRMLLPLLRYSTSSFNEIFFSAIINDLLNIKLQKIVSFHYKYHKVLLDYTRTFLILQVAFEKIPPASLESPNSSLYKEMKPPQSWAAVRMGCRLCDTLRAVTVPSDAGETFRKDYRLFQCANYNCYSAAICRRRPDERFYVKLFEAHVWDKLVDRNRQYKLYIRGQWNQRTHRQAVSIDVEPSPNSSARSITRTTLSVRTRMFARTLSENPLMYDLIGDNTVEEVKTQDVQLPSNELNRHECAAALTALVCHVSLLAPHAWADMLATGVRLSHTNSRWLLAQVICNCKEELKPHASYFRAALLDLIATTAVEENGKRVLNGLHVDILDTLSHWGDDSPSPSPTIDLVAALLITTCLEHRPQVSIFRTLTDVLTKFFTLYATVVNIGLAVFEPYLADQHTPKTIQILQRISKCNVYIPSLVPTLLNKLENKQYSQLNALAELLGLALNTCTERHAFLIRFRKVLDQVRRTSAGDYIKMLYYAQNGCAEICDEQNFRMTTDLTQKIVGAEKTKCLKILLSFIITSNSTYIQDMFETIDVPDLITNQHIEAFEIVKAGIKTMTESLKKRFVTIISSYTQHSLIKLRKMANEVMLEALDDILTETEQPAAKKMKISTSKLIEKIFGKDLYVATVIGAIAQGLIDKNVEISGMVKSSLAKMMHKDMGIRLTESFFLTIYLPSTSSAPNCPDLSVCASAFLDLLLAELRARERFKKLKLRDEPLVLNTDVGSSKLLTKSRTYQGTFRTRTLTSKRKYYNLPTTQNSQDIDVQISLENILNTLIQFTKDSTQASNALSIQFIQALRPSIDLGDKMADALAAILNKGVNELTPFVVGVCQVFIEDICKVDNIQETVENLVKMTRNTDGGGIIKQLHQDVKLRCNGYEQFVLGAIEECPDDVTMEHSEFCIEDLTSAFGQLSNWDTLTIQQRSRIHNSALPSLWTDKDKFLEQLQGYTPSTGWFNKMVSAYKRENKEDVMKWYRHMDKWPARHFEISATTEAIVWQTSREDRTHEHLADIQPSDCLVEWAARLMIRTAHRTSKADLDQSQGLTNLLSRSDELIWCESANERALGHQVLQCVKRNTPEYVEETLPWLCQRVIALYNIGVKERDDDMLRKALLTAETHTPQFVDDTSADVVVGMNKMILVLNRTLNSLTKTKLQDVFQMLDMYTEEEINSKHKSRQNLKAIHELAMSYYDDLWDSDSETEENQNVILKDMLQIIARSTEYNLFTESLLAVLINRLDGYKGKSLQDGFAKQLLELVNRNLTTIDDFTIQALKTHSRLFPSRSLLPHPYMSASETEDVVKYKRCFQLLCDAEYSLLQYCGMLRNALKKSDEDDWEEIFKRIKFKLFDNPFAGSDYQLLNRYKSKLFEIYEYDMSPSFKSSAEKTLKELGRLLLQRGPQTVLRLSQLCPALSRCQDCPVKLFGLRDQVAVVKIDEQVTVLNSIRRPVLLKVLFSDGRTRRYLLKSGEPLMVDAAAQRVLTYAHTLWGLPPAGYHVTPVSEDCGLIEFLEDHDTLRSLIGGSQLLDAALDTVPRPADHELIVSSMAATLSQHYQLSDKVPSYLLRQSIVKRCASEQDRCIKMNNYRDTFASATILTWILGLGDRHLENILYSIKDGRLCHIDWGAIFQYGAVEIPPARITRNLLAVCDAQELEARLQQLLATLRSSSKMFLAIIKIYFKWMNEAFDEKYKYMESIVNGTSLSYNVTRTVVQKHKMEELYKTKHVELLDNIFQDFECKDYYSVEEQISCLLRQSTDPQILSITRSGWEPWV